MMRRLVQSIVAATAIVAVSMSLMGLVFNSEKEHEAWLEACILIVDEGYNCDDVTQPLVVYRDLSEENNAGVYNLPSRSISLSDEADVFDPYWYVVLVHEMTHYIQHTKEGWPDNIPYFLGCFMEDVAYRVSNKVALRLEVDNIYRPN